MSGKGSNPRPYSVPLSEFDKNWDAIFKKPDPKEVQDAENEEEAWDYIERLNNLKGNKNANESS